MGTEVLHFTPKASECADRFERFRGRTTVVAGIDQMFLLFEGAPEKIDAVVVVTFPA